MEIIHSVVEVEELLVVVEHPGGVVEEVVVVVKVAVEGADVSSVVRKVISPENVLPVAEL